MIQTRRVFLAAMRGELLTPVHAVLDVAQRLLGESEAAPPQLLADLQKIDAAAGELLAMIHQALSPEALEAEIGGAEFRRLQSCLRHEMLNKLNPVINYSEMWLEEAGDRFLDGLVPDLQ